MFVSVPAPGCSCTVDDRPRPSRRVDGPFGRRCSPVIPSRAGGSGTLGPFPYDVCVVGGCGHVGLPLALAFARSGLNVSVYDIDDRAVETVRAGRMPFLESGAEPILREVI